MSEPISGKILNTSEMKSSSSNTASKNTPLILTAALWIAGGLLTLLAMIAIALIVLAPSGNPVGGFVHWLFALDSVQMMWYITRSAGITAYLVLWLSVAWGLAVSSRILDTLLHRSFTYEYHQFLSLLSIGFIALHIVVLYFDRYLPYTITQVLVPFLSPYRPVWVGLGVIAFYLTLLVTVTFYMRSRIGMKAFRSIHLLSLVAYLGVAVHGLMSGTDSSLPAMQIMYLGTFLSTIFLLAYWLIAMLQKKFAKSAGAQSATSRN
jgi:methionine sulfoxide reductase heme-binding subunit